MNADRWGRRTNWAWAWCVSDGCANTNINLLPKQTNKIPSKKSVECIFEAGIINFCLVQTLALEDWLCLNSASQKKAEALRGIGRDGNSESKMHRRS